MNSNKYSKISDIYIPVKGYKYFHNPSSINQTDFRFIGREDIIRRLLTLFKHSVTKNGAYLVTGYRGIGKTSYVNIALNLLDKEKHVLKLTTRQKWLLSLLTKIALAIYLINRIQYLLDISFTINPIDFVNVLILVGFIDVISIIIVFINRDNYKTLIRSDDQDKNDKSNEWYLILTIAVIFFLTNLILITLLPTVYYVIHFAIQIFLYLAIVIIDNRVHFYIQRNKLVWEGRGDKIKLMLLKPIKDIVKSFWKRRNLIINVNLGYQDVSKFDLLVVISRNLNESYKKLVSDSKNKWKKINWVIIVVTFIIVGINPTSDNTIENKPEIKNQSLNFGIIFPSQTLIESTSNNHNNALALIDTLVSRINQKKSGNSEKNVINNFDLLVQRLYLNAWFVLSPKEVLTYSYLEYTNLINSIVLSIILIIFSNTFLTVRNKKNKDISAELNNLIEAINIQITTETSNDVKMGYSDFFLGRNKRKVKQYKLSTDRDLEDELKEVLVKISNNKKAPSLIFIIDELDKIDHPSKNTEVANNDSLASHNEGTQKKITELFKETKGFANKAQAKFIFISGRETYDMVLSEVSEPQSITKEFIHTDINVNSYYTDPHGDMLSDVTSMTAEYVCNYLVSENNAGELADIKAYSKEIDKYTFLGEEEKKHIIKTLHNFIIYLTYRSNGIPKNVTSLFERYIEYVDIKHMVTSNKQKKQNILLLANGDHFEGLVLHFDVYDQYTFNMIAYLIEPIFLSVNKVIKDYGDKLIVSSSYLIDQIYRFHRFSFGHKNVLRTPDMLDKNKSPHLSKMIEDVLAIMRRAYLQRIDNGIYDYKFTKKITQEIIYISKISERESAAFNFSLNESYKTKQYYLAQLSEIESKKVSGFVAKSSPMQIYQALGDIYFYDEEYDRAISTYNNAIHIARELNDMMEVPEIMLKLGLTYERKWDFIESYKSYSNAHNIFLTKRDEKIIGTSIAEGLKTVYQPLLSAVHTMEKAHGGGINKKDCAQIEIEIKKINNKYNKQKTEIFTIDLNNRYGDILYFKNSKYLYEERYCNTKKAITIRNKKPGVYSPCDACKKYHDALKIELKHHIKNSIFELIDIVNDPNGTTDKMNTIANLFSDIADTYLSCDTSQNYNESILKYICDSIQNIKSDELPIPKNKFEQSLIFMLLSGIAYMKAGEKEEYCAQLSKIIGALYEKKNMLFTHTQQENNKKSFDEMVCIIENEIIQIYSTAYDGTPILSEKIFCEMLEDNVNINDKIKYYNPVYWDITELVHDSLLLRSNNNREKILSNIKKDNILVKENKDRNISYGVYNRIQQLVTIERLNTIEYSYGDKSKIYDSMYCCNEIIRISNAIGIGYIVTNTFMSYVHGRMEYWCNEKMYVIDEKREDDYIKEKGEVSRKENNEKITNQDELSDWLEKGDQNTLFAPYHRSKKEYYKQCAKELHAEGRTYKEQIKGIYHLNDDLNDNTVHYNAAKERYRLNNSVHY